MSDQRPTRRGFRLIEFLIVVAVVACLLGLCMGGGAIVEGPFLVLFGWVKFLWRVVPGLSPNPATVFLGLGYLLAFLVGLHLFLRWFVGRMTPAEGTPARSWRLRWTLALAALVLLAFTAGIGAVGITHQTAWLIASPEPLTERRSRLFARVASANNLKHLGHALQNYESQHNKLPPGATFDARGTPMHSWQTFLLPYIEQERLHKEINLGLPWDHPTNAGAFATIVWTYQHPEGPATKDGLALSHFAANANVLGGDVPLSLKQLPGGAAQTILAGEAAGNFKSWGHPLNWRDPARGLNRGPDGFGHPTNPRGPTQFLFADGSVRVFRGDTDPEFLELLAVPPPKK
jgi:hypothetical protein